MVKLVKLLGALGLTLVLFTCSSATAAKDNKWIQIGDKIDRTTDVYYYCNGDDSIYVAINNAGTGSSSIAVIGPGLARNSCQK